MKKKEITEEKDGGSLLALGVLVGLGFYLWMKSPKQGIEAKAKESKAANPDLTDQEASALAAAAAAEAAADAAAQAEAQAGIDAQTAAMKEAERLLAGAQAAAILASTEAALKAAKEAEAKALVERQALEESWRKALELAQAELVKAKAAADVAMGAYEAQLAHLLRPDAIICYEHINYGGKYLRLPGGTIKIDGFVHHIIEPPDLDSFPIKNDTISSVRVREGFSVTLYDKKWYGGSSVSLYKDHYNLSVIGFNDKAASLRVFNDRALATLDRVNLEARAALTAARLVTERCLTTAADVRLLGILLTLADRLDSIARATAEKIAEMMKKLG